MKKMKELGLIFKAPTKRSTANAKNVRIRNEQNVEDMSELEKIIPTKKKQNTKPKKLAVPKKNVVAKKPLNIGGVKKLVDELDGTLQDVLNWLEESIRDAIEDIVDDDASDDPDDGIPLVPFNGEQRDAMENQQFCDLLKELGFHAPVEGMVSRFIAVGIPFLINVFFFFCKLFSEYLLANSGTFYIRRSHTSSTYIIW